MAGPGSAGGRCPVAVLLGWRVGLAVGSVPQSRTQVGGLGQFGLGGTQLVGIEHPSWLLPGRLSECGETSCFALTSPQP